MTNQQDNSRKVLFVIDVQEDSTGKTAKAPFPYRNSIELIEKINFIINRSKEENIDV